MAAEDPLAELKNESFTNLLAIARVMESAERFEDMCSIMGSLVKRKHEAEVPLEVEERNMLSVAYKNVVGAHRKSWRALFTTKDDREPEANELCREYLKEITGEIDVLCNEVLNLLDTGLIQNSRDDETKVFFLKMGGDYSRYLCEVFMDDPKRPALDGKAKDYYQKAMDASTTLDPTDPTRLALVLNYSVFLFEILGDCEQAIQVSNKGFDDAIEKLDYSTDTRDATLILQLLKDNADKWNYYSPYSNL